MNENTQEHMKELIFNLWKKRASYFFVFLLYIMLIITYVINIQPATEKTVWQSLDVFVIGFISLPFILLIAYIAYKRNCLPKAKRDSIGILFCVYYNDSKQAKIVYDKFINPFRAMINSSVNFDYDVIVLDDYFADKYFKKLQKLSSAKEVQADLLKKTGCKVIIWGSCIACSESENSSCKISFPRGISYKSLDGKINKTLNNHLKEIFAPLKEIYISKENETKDFDDKAVVLGCIFKYILAISNLLCENVKNAIKCSEDLGRDLPACDILPRELIVIKNNYSKLVGVCYAMLSNYEYENFVENRDISHLERAKEYMSHSEIDEVNYNKGTFMTICVFKLERNVDKALSIAEQCSQSEPIAKINKAFLKLYKNCNATNIKNAYHAYVGGMSKIPNERIYELEMFIYEEYNMDKNKWQLLFLLAIIYLYQENLLLAKNCFNQFCKECGNLINAKSLSSIMNTIKMKLNESVIEAE